MAGYFFGALVGGAVAKTVDRKLDNYAYNLKVTDTTTVKITPGTIGSLVLLLGLAILPGSNATGIRAALAAVGIGGAVIEGADAFAVNVLPRLDSTPAVKGLPPGYVAGMPAGQPPPQRFAHVGYGGQFAGQHHLADAMARWGRMAA